MGNRQSCCVSNRRFRTHSAAGKSNTGSTSETGPSGASNMGRTTSSMTKYKVDIGTTITNTSGNQSSVDTSQHRLSKNISSMPAPLSVSQGSGIIRDQKIGSGAGGSHQVSSDVSTRKSREVPDPRVVAFFERYRDCEDSSDAILVPGVESLCSDLNLSPDEFRILLLAWSAGADRMCSFTRDEFYTACRSLHADTPATMSAALSELAADVSSNQARFRDLYRWSYQFALDKEISQRSLPVDMAVAMWKLLFTNHSFNGSSKGVDSRGTSDRRRDSQRGNTETHRGSHGDRGDKRSSKRKESTSRPEESGSNAISLPHIVERWLEFLSVHSMYSVIPRDTWDMFLHFVITVGDDLAAYCDEEAWPSLLDDFVEYETDRRNQNLVGDHNGSAGWGGKDD